MKIIGVTGGIGAGKTSVSSILKDMGAEVIDADILSHRAVEKEKPAYDQIIKEFGPEVLSSDLTLNRRKLAEIVFERPEALKRLETIIHTEVVREMLERIDALKTRGYEGMAVLDVPIPVRNGFLDVADTVWVVTADEETRIKRIMQRSGLSLEEAKRRIQSQMPQEEYIRLGDEIIENNGDLENLRKRVQELVRKITGK